LQCKCGCNSLVLAEGFAENLRQLRELFKQPMIINSCCRCPRNNAVVGGAIGFIGYWLKTWLGGNS